MENTIVTNGHSTTDAAIEAVLNAPVEENGTDKTDWLATLTADLNAKPDDVSKLVKRVYEDLDRNGNVKGTHTFYYSSDHTTVEVPADLHSAYSGKNVISLKGDWTDRVLRDLALVKGGTRAYEPLPMGRDSNGLPRVDTKVVGKFRKAAERLSVTDKAAAHRLDLSRLTVMPAADGAKDEKGETLGGFLRIVFTGTRVK